MGIETKTIGQLFDELATTNIKCFWAQETGPTRDLEKAQFLNNRRCQLILAIDKLLGSGQDHPAERKTYE